MKILIINARIGSGSVGKIVSDIYEGLITNGDECKVAYSRGKVSGVKIEDTIKIGNSLDVYSHVALTRLFGSTSSYSKTSTKKLIDDIEKFAPDIVHIHGIYGYFINMEILFNYLAKANIPVVSTLHSCWDFTGHCCYFNFAKCNQWKTICHKCSQKNTYPESLLFENVQKNFIKKNELYHKLSNITIVCPCNWMNQNASESFLKDLNRTIIYNGIDLNKFKPFIDDKYLRKLSLNQTDTVILSIANTWDERKGFNDIIELSKHADEKTKIVIVGKISTEQKEMLNNKIIYIERTDSFSDLACLYTFADIVFNPTYDDNYPTVNLEAIACHTAVVTYNTGGSAESLLGNKYGIVVDKKDYNTVLEYAKIIHNKEIIIDYSNLDFINKKRMVNEHIQLYNNIILGKARTNGQQ